MQFKKEVGLLLFAISLFAVATFFYSYETISSETNILTTDLIYPYRSLALAIVGVGFVSMVVASISYSRKTKDNITQQL